MTNVGADICSVVLLCDELEVPLSIYEFLPGAGVDAAAANPENALSIEEFCEDESHFLSLGQGGRLILEAEQEITSGCEVAVREYIEPDSIEGYELSLCEEPEGEICETYFIDDGGDFTVIF